MDFPHLIGLTGRAGTGKDTIRAILEHHHGFRGLAFADPMRKMIAALLTHAGKHTLYMSERELKEREIDGLGSSYRQMAQTLGTEWGRTCMGEDFWLKVALQHLEALPLRTRVVFSDVRFVNEAQALRDLGGQIWRVERPAAEPVRTHASEFGLEGFTVDKVIMNTGPIARIPALVLHALSTSDEVVS